MPTCQLLIKIHYSANMSAWNQHVLALKSMLIQSVSICDLHGLRSHQGPSISDHMQSSDMCLVACYTCLLVVTGNRLQDGFFCVSCLWF